MSPNSVKELVIELRIPLPEGRVEHATAIIAADAFERSLVESATAAFGEGHYKLASRTHTRVPARSGPRKRKGAAAATDQAAAVEGPAVESVSNGADQAPAEHHASRRGKTHSADQPTA